MSENNELLTAIKSLDLTIRELKSLEKAISELGEAVKSKPAASAGGYTPPKASNSFTGWRAVEVPPFIKKYAGKSLGEMAARDLHWWAENYTPKEWKGEIQQRDIDFKAALVAGAAEIPKPAESAPKPKPAPTEREQSNQSPSGEGGNIDEDVPFAPCLH